MDFITIDEWLERFDRLIDEWQDRIREAKEIREPESYYEDRIIAIEECIQDLERCISEIYGTHYTMYNYVAPMVTENTEQ